jgi:tripartite motif-containing protein 71
MSHVSVPSQGSRSLLFFAVLTSVVLASCLGPTASLGPSELSREPAISGLPGATKVPATASPALGLEVVWQVDDVVSKPTGLAIAPDGSVLVADYGANRLVRLSGADGSEQGSFGMAGSGPGQFNSPLGIAVGQDGTVYVADHTNYRVQVFSGKGAYLRRWGSLGDGPGKFGGPDGIAIGPDGLIYVSDDADRRIQLFDTNGEVRAVWQGQPTPEFGDPTGIAFVDDRVYVGDYDKGSIWILDATGAEIGLIGDPNADDGPSFSGVGQLAADTSGRIYALDYGVGRILVFEGSEQVAAYELPDGKPFARPWGIAIGRDGDIYVSEYSAGRISRLRVPAQ